MIPSHEADPQTADFRTIETTGRKADLQTIELVAESLTVASREVVTGRVRVSTVTESFEEVVRRELRETRAEVARVPINRTLGPDEAPPEPRTEGEVTIIPVFEEVLVVEKRVVLKEELHITRITTTEHAEIPVTLRRQHAVVERSSSAEDTSNPGEDT